MKKCVCSSQSPVGARDDSPQRELWEYEARWRKAPEGRKNAVLPPLPGLIAAFMPFPRLAPWANFFRPYGALLGVLRP
jgi:hypothetical protein